MREARTWLVIDGFEGDLARVELPGGGRADLPRAWLPAGAREGDHVRFEAVGDGLVRFEVDAEATVRARERAQDSLDAITEEPPEDFRV